jgi:hypothetical protein
MEVSPGNWVHIDCERYQPSAKAIVHLSTRKARLVKAHKQMYKPLRTIRLKPRPGAPAPAASVAASRGVGASAAPPGGPAQVAESFPATVDHRTDNTEGPIKNQGGVGSCTAHSLSATLDNAAIRAGNLKPGDRNGAASPLHIWSRYGLPNMGAAADANIAQPVAGSAPGRRTTARRASCSRGKAPSPASARKRTACRRDRSGRTTT